MTRIFSSPARYNRLVLRLEEEDGSEEIILGEISHLSIEVSHNEETIPMSMGGTTVRKIPSAQTIAFSLKVDCGSMGLVFTPAPQDGSKPEPESQTPYPSRRIED